MINFFLIGKKKYIKKTARCKLAPTYQKYQKDGKAKTKKDINYKERELRNRGGESLDVIPQALAQSNRNQKREQAVGPQIYPNPQTSADCVPSKYTTSNTMELSSKCKMNASPTNSTN